ncbi:MAG: hypothetical protein ACLU9S_01900 [Oscillospiraceae bacterium]
MKYGLPVSFDALNRFRTGQMPMVIATSYFYGQVAVGAPEIARTMEHGTGASGTRQADGSVNRSEGRATVSGAVVYSEIDYGVRTHSNFWTGGRATLLSRASVLRVRRK